jgi:hypothetical protein
MHALANVEARLSNMPQRRNVGLFLGLTGQRREEGRFPYVKAPKNQPKNSKKAEF